MSKFGLTALAASTILSIGPAKATVIGFDHFNNSRQPAYAGHDEDGFMVRATKGNWREAFFFGTTAPSIFSRSDKGKVVVKSLDGSGFWANSVNVGNGSLYSGSVKYVLRGTMHGTEMFKVKGQVTSLQAFNKVMADSGQEIDKLVISVFSQQAASFNIDDIALTSASSVAPTPIPGPGSLPLLLGAGAILTGLRKRG